MHNVPQDLIRSLIELGLPESEARIYIALVIMNNSEVKELIDFSGISKPSAYEALRSLDNKGLIVLINERPLVYQAISPEIGLELLMDTHIKAKEEAKRLLSTLGRIHVEDRPRETVWYVFNKKSIEYKIRDMFQNAAESVLLMASDQYIKYLTPLSNANLDLDVTIFSENPNIEPLLKKIFKSDNARFQLINKAEMIKRLSAYKAGFQEEMIPSFEEILFMFNFDNMLIVIADDSDLLYVPPLSGDSLLAINLKNKLLSENMKLGMKAMATYLINKTAD
jgi:sugar-specific transcriptional regulator TrmB